jgi:hypothetical protein
MDLEKGFLDCVAKGFGMSNPSMDKGVGMKRVKSLECAKAIE